MSSSSSSSSSNSGSGASPLLSHTPEWADVTPVPLPADAAAVVRIDYSEQFLDTFGLLYACIEAGETSQRALKLTERCIELCNTHYTAWAHRFKVLRPACSQQCLQHYTQLFCSLCTRWPQSASHAELSAGMLLLPVPSAAPQTSRHFYSRCLALRCTGHR